MYNGSVAEATQYANNPPPVVATPPTMTRARMKELLALAFEAVAWAEEKGLKRGEQCIFREMCERLWWAD